MAATSKPTIVLVPGAWHSPDCYASVRTQLLQLGYEVDAVAHPTIGAEPPSKSLTDDAKNLHTTLEDLADAGKEIVLVLHSYGGLVGSCAVEGLGVEQRAQQRKKGGVLLVVYMTAFAIPKGKSLKECLPGGEWLHFVKVEGDYCYCIKERQVFYHDLSPEAQDKAIAMLKHICTNAFLTPSSYEPWQDLQCMYMFCEQDQAILLEMQELMAAGMGDILTWRLASSHSPMLSMPEKVVEGIEYGIAEAIAKRK